MKIVQIYSVVREINIKQPQDHFIFLAKVKLFLVGVQGENSLHCRWKCALLQIIGKNFDNLSKFTSTMSPKPVFPLPGI